jgi:hypothetical protein
MLAGEWVLAPSVSLKMIMEYISAMRCNAIIAVKCIIGAIMWALK